MEKLFTYLLIAIVGLTSIKVFIYWSTAKLTQKPKEKGGLTLRSKEVEKRYLKVKFLFNKLLKEKKLNRNDVLEIKDYLKSNVRYEKKKYKNDAHFIYSTLKNSPNIKVCHLYALEEYLKDKASMYANQK